MVEPAQPLTLIEQFVASSIPRALLHELKALILVLAEVRGTGVVSTSARSAMVKPRFFLDERLRAVAGADVNLILVVIKAIIEVVEAGESASTSTSTSTGAESKLGVAAKVTHVWPIDPSLRKTAAVSKHVCHLAAGDVLGTVPVVAAVGAAPEIVLHLTHLELAVVVDRWLPVTRCMELICFFNVLLSSKGCFGLCQGRCVVGGQSDSQLKAEAPSYLNI